MNLNRILAEVFALTLIGIPNVNTYASSIISSGCGSYSTDNYKYYNDNDFCFQYTIENKQITITQVRIIYNNSEYVNGNGVISTNFNDNTSFEYPTKLIFPNEIDGIPVTTIGHIRENETAYSLKGLEYIKYVEMPNNVTTILDNAFKDCPTIEEFSSLDNITYIGKNAFEDTKWFKNQKEGLLYIGKVAYKYIGNAPTGEIILKDDTTSISSRCFYGQPIEKITIPKSVTDIGLQAFLNCYNLKDVTVLNKDIDKENLFYKPTIGLYNINDDEPIQIVDGLIIHGYTGSTAESYVNLIRYLHKDSNISFDYLDTPEIVGDINNDGKITTTDLMLLKDKILNRITYINGDINDDNNINVLDLIILKNKLLNNMEDF